jgi:hypothetical protein
MPNEPFSIFDDSVLSLNDGLAKKVGLIVEAWAGLTASCGILWLTQQAAQMMMRGIRSCFQMGRQSESEKEKQP